jgi:hypothetical protein
MRKLVMTVLTLALILGSISVASAATGKVKLTDIDGNSNEEAIQVTYDLDIVTGTPEGSYEPDKAVNRAEFAALITRALAIPESALSSYSSTTFKDTSGYGWAVPYLAILQQRGIMKGDGYGNAMPGRTITPNEAVTMVLRAIGYTDNASVLVGQWPANYVALGQSQNLYDKVANDLQMNKASAAQMVYNVLTKQLVQVDANSTVKYLYDADNPNNEEQNLLVTSLNCVSSGKKVVTYGDAAKSKINLIPSVGAYGILYSRNGDVVALDKVSTQFLSGRFTFKGDGTADSFQTTDGVKYTLSNDLPDPRNEPNGISPNAFAARFVTPGGISAPNNTAIFLNGDPTSLSAAQINKYVVDDTGATVENVPAYLTVAAKVNGMTITDLRSVAVWIAQQDGTDIKGDNFLYESGQIDGKKFYGHEFPLDLNNEVDHTGYLLKGVDSIEDIAVDNVIYIYKNSKTDKITRIDVGTGTQSGTITNISSPADWTWTIGGTALLGAPWSGNGWSGLERVGNEGTALLDVFGRIYDFKLGEASRGNYAAVVDVQTDGTWTGPAKVNYKIFDKSGNEVIYEWDNTSTSATKDDLIEYRISGGKIQVIGTVGSGAAKGHVNKAGTMITIDGRGYVLDSGALVYAYDGKAYRLSSVNDVLDVDLTNRLKFKTDDKGIVKSLIVDDDQAGAQKLFVMINSISDGWNGTEQIDVVHGLSFKDGLNAAAGTWNYNNNSLSSTAAPAAGSYNLNSEKGNYGTAGDIRGLYPTIVKFTLDANGTIKSAEIAAKKEYDGTTLLRIGNARFITNYTSNGGNSVIKYTTSTALSGLIENNIAFTNNAVLYKIEAGSWVAYRVRDYNFDTLRDTDGDGVYDNFFGVNAVKMYTFLQSDPKGDGFDIVIEQSKAITTW